MKRLALFVGSDVTSWLICHDVLSQLRGLAEIRVIFPKHKGKPAAHPELRRLAAYERGLLEAVVFPMIENASAKVGPYSGPISIRERFRAMFASVDDINDEGFFDSLRSLDGVVSIRCYQKFSPRYVDHFDGDRILWNLHPGDLPSYRGVMTCFRAMQNNDAAHAFTLHRMDASWDSGDVLGKVFGPLRRDLCFLSNMMALHPFGSSLLVDELRRFLAGETFRYEPQGSGRYWHFPGDEELRASLADGLKLVDHVELREAYADLFFRDASSEARAEFFDRFDQLGLRAHG